MTTLAQVSAQADATDDGMGAHEARSVVRRLAAALLSAWDGADEAGFASCCTENAEVSGFGDQPLPPQPALLAQLARVPQAMHWLGNEQIQITGGHGTASWLWWSAERAADGQSLHAGGDLSAELELTAAGWRFSTLAFTPRYRCPVADGWLAEPLMATPARADVVGVPVAAPFGPLPVPGLPDSAALDVRLAALDAERRVRVLMADFIDAVETNRPNPDHWAATAEYIGEDDSVTGFDAIAARLAQEWSAAPTTLRVVAGEHLAPAGDHVVGHWRELRVATVNGVARWQACHYRGIAVATEGRWRWLKLQSRRVLDTAYGENWAF